MVSNMGIKEDQMVKTKGLENNRTEVKQIIKTVDLMEMMNMIKVTETMEVKETHILKLMVKTQGMEMMRIQECQVD